eukprot:940463-Amphidinium_carterae.1
MFYTDKPVRASAKQRPINLFQVALDVYSTEMQTSMAVMNEQSTVCEVDRRTHHQKSLLATHMWHNRNGVVQKGRTLGTRRHRVDSAADVEPPAPQAEPVVGVG